MRTFNFLRNKYPEQNVRNAGYCVSLLFIFELSQATCAKNDRSQYYRKAIMLKNAGSWKKKKLLLHLPTKPQNYQGADSTRYGKQEERVLPKTEMRRWIRFCTEIPCCLSPLYTCPHHVR